MRGLVVTLLCTSFGYFLKVKELITFDTFILILLMGLISQQIIYSRKK